MEEVIQGRVSLWVSAEAHLPGVKTGRESLEQLMSGFDGVRSPMNQK
jgi:hypothetical protein